MLLAYDKTKEKFEHIVVASNTHMPNVSPLRALKWTRPTLFVAEGDYYVPCLCEAKGNVITVQPNWEETIEVYTHTSKIQEITFCPDQKNNLLFAFKADNKWYMFEYDGTNTSELRELPTYMRDVRLTLDRNRSNYLKNSDVCLFYIDTRDNWIYVTYQRDNYEVPMKVNEGNKNINLQEAYILPTTADFNGAVLLTIRGGRKFWKEFAKDFKNE